ncbi:ribonuclease HII [Sphingobacteriales bacterium UPWRP_1]|nr:ribonuclease HII [Sphingobacteriales bacterium TSM_CSM]PSJ74377.1 ribonuclease HII [Sphingobacteriales bacterium UPWRP_1]
MISLYFQEQFVEAGCDEAGRGCLAGPVFAAAVILPPGFKPEWVNDSKQLSEKQRFEARMIIEQEAVAWAIGMVSAAEIDEINILNASFLAMHRALEQLQPQPEMLIVDGNRFKPYKKLPYHCVVGGDALYASVSAASVLAKTGRDAYMQQLHHEFPAYGWFQNKGYPTAEHRQAIAKHGFCTHHRQSFRLLPLGRQMDLF